MTDVVYYVAASLDGYIATPDGGVEWLSAFEATGEDYGYAEFYASVDAVLLGRKTYEQSLSMGDWPYPGKPCWVWTRRPLATARPGVRMTDQSPGRVVAELQSRGVTRAWLVGGGTLAASFRAERLITEYRIAVIPVILGSGIPLFAATGPTQHLTLIESKMFRNSIVQLYYLPNRKP